MYYYGPRYPDEIVTVLGLVGGAPGGETPRDGDSSGGASVLDTLASPGLPIEERKAVYSTPGEQITSGSSS